MTFDQVVTLAYCGAIAILVGILWFISRPPKKPFGRDRWDL